MTALSVFFLTLARLIPIVAIAPFFGGKNVPRTVRMMFAVSLCVIFLPQNLLLIHQNIPYSILFIGLIVKELAIGFFLAFMATVPFYIVQTAGSLIDHSRGASSLQVTDPSTQTQTGPIGILYNYVLIAVFFALNGPFLFFDAVASSYQLVPIDGLLNAAFFNLKTPFWKQFISMLQKIMNLSIQFAAPALIGILLTDLFLGIANRLAPQVQVVFLGIPLKSWVGIALMTAAWTLTIQVMGKESLSWIKSLKQLITQASYSVSQ
jgi:type III secretion protein T